MKKIVLSAIVLLVTAITGIAYGQERVSDYFYPEGKSEYFTFKTEDSSQPIEKIAVLYERNSRGARITECPPIPLLGGFRYRNPMEYICFAVDVTDTAVTVRRKWTQQDINSEGPAPAGDTVWQDTVLLKMPSGKEPVTWTTNVKKDGKVWQIWEMSAARVYTTTKENGSWIAVHALKVQRKVFDPQHNPVPKENVTEFWIKGKGKARVIWN